MELLTKVLKRNEAVAWRVIEEEALLVNPKDSLIYPLNSVGARIWELLDGTRTLSQVVGVVVDEFDVVVEVAEKDVAKFVQEMVEKGLVVP